MKKSNTGNQILDMAGKKIREDDAVSAETIRPSISKLIKKKFPNWSTTSYISKEDLKEFRKRYIEELLKKEKGELSRIEKEVLNSLLQHETIVKNTNVEIDRSLTFGERWSDKIANFAGSWNFISIFFVTILLWVAVNSLRVLTKPIDPFPFILLNLVLSCLAAVQAPIILMSQNRKETRDRLRAENDYKINLKSELEIRLLHEKIDHLAQVQWKRLLEIQQLQIDLLEEDMEKIHEK
ncbi:MAG: DUF1003 domain-containing protein [Methanocellales archaeon]|nr:DUF1003 domain-containing protein [Methanocellales archaeon]